MQFTVLHTLLFIVEWMISIKGCSIFHDFKEIDNVLWKLYKVCSLPKA